MLFVSHGGVGTLLFCALSVVEIEHEFGQAPGGGCWFPFDRMDWRPHGTWRPMEELSGDPG